ncbi:MAG: protein disulfide oxidoreductase [Gallionella sp.]
MRNLNVVNKVWRGRILQLLLFVLLIAGIRLWQQRDMVSGAAPMLQGMTLAGQPYTLPAHPDHPVLVHFWASWCPICRTEQSSIADIAKDYPNAITVAMQSGKADAVTSHMREQGIEFPVVNDPDGSIARAWGVHAVPVSFIVAPDGKIRFVEVGYTTGMGLRIRLWLAGL